MSHEPALGEPQVELAELHDVQDYRICKDQLDPRGWSVRTADDRDLGSISDLVIDKIALNARYLVCNISPEARRVLIPTGFARLDDRERLVHLDFITHADVQRLPTYNGLPLSADEQRDVESALTLREHSHAQPLIVRRHPERAD